MRRVAPRSSVSTGVQSAGAHDNHVYRIIQIAGSSKTSISDAIDKAIARAHKTLRNLRWFEVVRTAGHVADGKVEHYQVVLEVGFTMEDSKE